MTADVEYLENVHDHLKRLEHIWDMSVKLKLWSHADVMPKLAAVRCTKEAALYAIYRIQFCLWGCYEHKRSGKYTDDVELAARVRHDFINHAPAHDVSIGGSTLLNCALTLPWNIASEARSRT